MNRVVETDVLVIGGGGAGCRAAIEAHDQGVDVLMMVKGTIGNSGCTVNVGTSAAVGPWGDPDDTHLSSMRDLLAHGGFLGNQDLVKVLAEESPDRILELQDWGIDFERELDGSILINRSARHSYARNMAFKPTAPSRYDRGYPPGIALMQVLEDELRKRNVMTIEDVMLVDLLTADGRVVGATGLDYVNNELVVFKSKSTILATGTYSHVFSAATVSPQETGDGQAAAYRAGAELIDMEGTQFIASHTGYRPWSVFTNAKGEEFLPRHGIHNLEGVDKEALCRAVWQEIKDGGGTERDTIFIDLSPAATNGEEVPESWLEHLRTLGTVYFGFEGGVGFDPFQGPVETAPLAHTTTGGVRINTRCESTVPGLYAAGAVAGGVYGHARPEGYTSMITLVFGRRAGLYGAEAAKAIDAVALDEVAVQASVDRASWLLEQSKAFDPAATKKRVQTIMKRWGWVIKDELGLKQGLRELADVEESLRVLSGPSGGEAALLDGDDRVTAIEVPNLLLCSQLMLSGAIERRDSRGAFFRDEYPDADDENWLKNIIYRQVDGELALSTEPVDLRYVGPQPRAVEAGR